MLFIEQEKGFLSEVTLLVSRKVRNSGENRKKGEKNRHFILDG
jgi:hypothetical protein